MLVLWYALTSRLQPHIVVSRDNTIRFFPSLSGGPCGSVDWGPSDPINSFQFSLSIEREEMTARMRQERGKSEAITRREVHESMQETRGRHARDGQKNVIEMQGRNLSRLDC